MQFNAIWFVSNLVEGWKKGKKIERVVVEEKNKKKINTNFKETDTKLPQIQVVCRKRKKEALMTLLNQFFNVSIVFCGKNNPQKATLFFRSST